MSRLDRIGERVRSVCDRFWLFTIAAIALAIVGFIAVAVLWKGMPAGAGELLSGITTGLLMIAQKVIEAQQARRLADQLAQSAPAPEPVAETTIRGER
ncbi:hypothetical protein [Sphingomonas sp.]|uniref:hypothetical protein n=1 Tax=Sphingomonas sp. TaxID=28214 RepID=UPI00307ED320